MDLKYLIEDVSLEKITHIKSMPHEFPDFIKVREIISNGRNKILEHKNTTTDFKNIPHKVEGLVKEFMSHVFSYFTHFRIKRGWDHKRASHHNGDIYIHRKLTDKMETLFVIRSHDNFEKQLNQFIKELDSSLTHEMVHREQEGEPVSPKSGVKEHLSSWKEVEAYAIQIAEYFKIHGVKNEHILEKINQLMMSSRYAHKLAEKDGLTLVANKLRMYKETVDPETFNILVNKIIEHHK